MIFALHFYYLGVCGCLPLVLVIEPAFTSHFMQVSFVKIPNFYITLVIVL